MIRIALALLVAMGLAACAPDISARRADGTCPLIRVAEMPLEARANMLFVRGWIDDAPVDLLVDTGAERTLLTEATVERLQLPRDFERATRTYGIGTPTAAWDAKLPTGLVLGGTRFPVDRVTVGNFDIAQVAGGPADGLLGADILLAFDLDLDLPMHRITFYRARRECPEAAPPWDGPYIAIDGIGVRRDRLLVPFELDGVAGLGVLDTGAQLSSISHRMAERIGVGPEQLAGDRMVTAHGAAPEHVPVHLHRFREFRVGPALLPTPLLPVVPMSSGMGDALVGADFLQGRRVWLSFSTQRVLVTPLERGPWIAVTRTGR